MAKQCNTRRELGIANTSTTSDTVPSKRFRVVRVNKQVRKALAPFVRFNTRIACCFPDSLATDRSGRRNPTRETIAERIRSEE